MSRIDLEKIVLQKRNYNNFIKGYLDYTSHLESPTEYHVWTAIGIIAGALRGKCFIDMGYFKWKPNCFIIFVAPPGIVAKSTTSGVGVDLLRNVPGINIGPSSCTWQSLLGSMAELEETFLVNKKRQRMSCVTVNASELGMFLNFRDAEMIDVIVDLWDGKDTPLVRRTVGGGQTEIAAPWINMLACTTPSWITQSMPRYSIGGGFTSRCVFVFADRKEKFVPYPADYIPVNHERNRKKLIEDLTRISLLEGSFTLSPEAKKLGEDWYIDFNVNKPQHLKTDQLAGYAARKQTHLHKVAMCLSAARSNDKVIEKQDLEAALSLLSVCEQNMNKVFNAITDDVDAGNLQMLKMVIREYPKGCSKKELFQDMSNRMSHDAFNRALDAGICAGYFKLTIGSDKKLIKPTYQLMNDSSYKPSEEDLNRFRDIKKGHM